jgi:hypothetical protein
MSPPVTLLGPKQADLAPKSSNPSQCVTRSGDGLVTDLQRRKVYKYKGKTLSYMYMSLCHAHTRAMRVCTRKGVVGRISGDGLLCDTVRAQIANREQISLDDFELAGDMLFKVQSHSHTHSSRRVKRCHQVPLPHHRR